MIIKFPKAVEGKNYVIDGSVWNRICDYTASFANMVVGPGLRLTRNSGGIALTLTDTYFRNVIVKITSNAAGGGKYNGRILSGTVQVIATSAVNMPNGMTVPSADNALVLNLSENVQPTHNIAVGSFVPGYVIGLSAGVSVVVVGGAGGGGSLTPIRITGNRTCGGAYSALVVVTGITAFNTSGSTYGDSDIGTDLATEVTVINLNERGQTTHSLTAGTPVMHEALAIKAAFLDDSGRDCYLIGSVDIKICTS